MYTVLGMLIGFIAFIFFGLASRQYEKTKKYTAGFWFCLIICIVLGFMAIGISMGDCYDCPPEIRSRM
jgi:hypothetical protein